MHMIRFSRTKDAQGSFYIWLEKAKNSHLNHIPFLLAEGAAISSAWFLFICTFTCKVGTWIPRASNDLQSLAAANGTAVGALFFFFLKQVIN